MRASALGLASVGIGLRSERQHRSIPIRDDFHFDVIDPDSGTGASHSMVSQEPWVDKAHLALVAHLNAEHQISNRSRQGPIDEALLPVRRERSQDDSKRLDS